MESQFKEISRHKDTLISSNSYETSSSSKVVDNRLKNNKKNTTSRLSLKFASLIEKESILDSSDPLETKEHSVENTLQPHFQNHQVKISIITRVDKNNDILSSFTIEIPGDSNIKNLIDLSIDKFNEYFTEKGMKIILIKNLNNYELRPSKKNGQPKMDLPSIDAECYVCDTKINQFTLIYKELDLIQYNEKKRSKCQKCLIL